jgi:hypothetical protein
VIDELNRTLRGIIRVATGLAADAVRPADQHGPTGDAVAEFATVRIMSMEPVGASSNLSYAADASPTATVVTENIDTVYRAVVSVNFFKGPAKDAAGVPKYSNAAFERAVLLPRLLHQASAVLAMQQAGIAFMSASLPRNLTRAVDNVNESRGQIDLTFSVANRQSQSVPTIEHVNLGLQIEWSQDDIEQRDIEVTP